MRLAVLVDAGFFLKRAPHIFRDYDTHFDAATAARRLHSIALQHRDKDGQQLHRVLVYDSPPALKKLHLPISKELYDLSQTDTAKFRTAFHQELRRLRKVALRLGHLGGTNQWILRPEPLKQLVSGKLTAAALTDRDFVYDVRQKGVDMRIGLDIAAFAFKKQVDQIVLIAGDTDFVPAAKLARREGIDFILDALWANVPDQLHEHIDGLRSVVPRPEANRRSADRHDRAP